MTSYPRQIKVFTSTMESSGFAVKLYREIGGRVRRSFNSYFLFVGLAVLGGLNAEAIPQLNSSVASATGGAGRAAIDPYGMVYLNPGSLARLKGRFFSALVARNQLGVTLLDSGSGTLLNGGFSYRQMSGLTDEVDGNKANLRQFTLTVADRAFNKFTFGFNIHFFDYRHVAEETSKKIQSDMGLTYEINRDWMLGITGQAYGLSSQGEEVDEMETYEALAVKSAVGITYVYDNFARFRFDMESESHHRWGQPVYLAGIESYLNDWMVWRVGYQIHSLTKKEYLSAGLGFSGPQFGLHYAYVQDIKDTKEFRHSVDLGLPF